MTMQKTVFTPEQLQRLSATHRNLCTQRNIDPHSSQGREVAGLLLDKCTGDEPDYVMVARLAN